jgi:HK97 family phage major capsid protein
VLTGALASGASQVTVTSDGAFGQEDIYKVWKALPERYRSRASFVISVDVNNRIRQMGTSTVFHAYTVGLPAGAADQLMNSPVYPSSYYPDFSGTTGQASILTVGDFRSAFTIARRAGMTVVLIPHLMGNANRPVGQRGLLGWARLGSAVTNPLGARILVNT